MTNNVKIILSAFIMAIIVSMLFLIVPITGVFITSYVFTLIAITGIALSLLTFGKYATTKAPQGHAFVYTAVIYAISNIIFSIIACMVNLSILWTIVIHTTILGIFIIIIISMSSGSDYTNKVNKVAEEKHKEFINEKENYWN